MTRTVSILKEQFSNLEAGYRNISSALSNIVEELESSPNEDIILSKVDEKLNITNNENGEIGDINDTNTNTINTTNNDNTINTTNNNSISKSTPN